MSKYFKIVLACAALVVFLFRVVPLMRKNVRCDAYNQFLLLSLNGVVDQKYIDSSQHSYKTVIIKNIKDSALEKVLLDFDLSGLYDHINVTDTIYKDIHDDNVFKSINGKKILISKADFGCQR